MTEAPKRFDRIIWIVLDSVGIGELPDAADYGDVGRDTLGHIARSRPLHLPNLVRLGLGGGRPRRGGGRPGGRGGRAAGGGRGGPRRGGAGPRPGRWGGGGGGGW